MGQRRSETGKRCLLDGANELRLRRGKGCGLNGHIVKTLPEQTGNGIEGLLGNVQLDRTKPLPRQIADHVRDLIRSGKISEGTKFPSIQRLAKVWGVTLFTINRGLKPLMQEGLLERQRKIGTTVKAVPVSRSLAVHFADRQLFGTGFYPELYVRLQEMILAAGYECRLCVDSRPNIEHSTPPADLQRAIAQREIVGVISLSIRQNEIGWLGKLPLPVVGVSGLIQEGLKVEHDFEQMFQHFFSVLTQAGCKKVGLITPFARDFREFFRAFDSVLPQHGQLSTHEAWQCCEGYWRDHSSFGYHALRKIWAQTPRPDAIIAYPDGTVDGVVLAAMMEGIRVPDDLQMCLHANDGVPRACPLEVHWAETSTSSMAQILVDSMRARLEGRVAPAKVVLPFRFRSGPSFPLDSGPTIPPWKGSIP
jgi:DNA-binding LacI/PurR family transcriptional regulator